MGLSRSFMISGICNLLVRNYKVDIDKVDLQAYVDSKLTFGENWTQIKKRFVRVL